jgi:hypothetical protein
MKANHTNTNLFEFYSGNEAKINYVHEADEVQETQLLGPDGRPYAIRRPKMKIGFDLTPRKR